MLEQIAYLTKRDAKMATLKLATRQCSSTDALLQTAGFTKQGEVKDRVLWIKASTYI